MSPIALHKVFKANVRHSLSFRLLSYILACSTLLALLITAVQLFWDYRQDRGMVESSLNQIEASFFAADRLQPVESGRRTDSGATGRHHESALDAVRRGQGGDGRQ